MRKRQKLRGGKKTVIGDMGGNAGQYGKKKMGDALQSNKKSQKPQRGKKRREEAVLLKEAANHK